MIRVQKYMIGQNVKKATRADEYSLKDVLVLSALVRSLQEKLKQHGKS